MRKEDTEALEYLQRKGYTRKEESLRRELENPGAAQMVHRNVVDVNTFSQSSRGVDSATNYISRTEFGSLCNLMGQFEKLLNWIDSGLDRYKGEIRRVLWPMFVHIYFEYIVKLEGTTGKEFLDKFRHLFDGEFSAELGTLEGVTTPEILRENTMCQKYKRYKYMVRMGSTSLELLLNFIEKNTKDLLGIANQSIDIQVMSKEPTNHLGKEFKVLEGFSVHVDSNVPVYWGVEDIALEDDGEGVATRAKDGMKKVRLAGQKVPSHVSERLPKMSLVERKKYFDDVRKRVSVNAKELPSIALYTLLNSHEECNTITLSHDASMAIGGFSDSSVRVWSLRSRKGEKEEADRGMGSLTKENGVVLRGHSGPVYGVDFSPDHRYALSCSGDHTVRLWDLDTSSNVVCYRGHAYPVWHVAFSPLGYYFATASHDRTAQLWSTDCKSPRRLFIGHLSDVDCVAFHPNCNYLATGSSDKTVRLWDIQTGACVRLFQGHHNSINALSFSPDGKMLASGGEDARIMLWDIGSGGLMGTFTGHESSVWSLSFSREGNVLASGSDDKTVRLWDVKHAMVTAEKKRKDGIAGQPGSFGNLEVFPTKKTPVYHVKFSRRNLLLAGGCFEP